MLWAGWVGGHGGSRQRRRSSGRRASHSLCLAVHQHINTQRLLQEQNNTGSIGVGGQRESGRGGGTALVAQAGACGTHPTRPRLRGQMQARISAPCLQPAARRPAASSAAAAPPAPRCRSRSLRKCALYREPHCKAGQGKGGGQPCGAAVLARREAHPFARLLLVPRHTCSNLGSPAATSSVPPPDAAPLESQARAADGGGLLKGRGAQPRGEPSWQQGATPRMRGRAPSCWQPRRAAFQHTGEAGQQCRGRQACRDAPAPTCGNEPMVVVGKAWYCIC